jgi:hypothetical protein
MAALMAAVDHHAYSVQMATSWCFRSLGLAVPSVLPKTLTKFLDSLQKTNNLLAADKTGEIMKKFRASGYALAALLSCAPETPLHVAPDVTTKVYNFSCGILKNMNRDHRIAAAQTRVAWTLIGSLLGQGPNLVKLHLPQLLNMWKLASKTGDTADKPVATTSSMRDPEEQLSLIIRESALGALYNFMINCGELVTADVTKKIITILNANLLYIGSLPPTPISIGMPSEIVGVPVPVLDDLIRKRVFLCFALIPAAKYEMMWEKLGKITIEAFTPTSDKAECPMTSMVPTVINKDDAAISGLVLDVDEVEMEEQVSKSITFVVALINFLADRAALSSLQLTIYTFGRCSFSILLLVPWAWITPLCIFTFPFTPPATRAALLCPLTTSVRDRTIPRSLLSTLPSSFSRPFSPSSRQLRRSTTWTLSTRLCEHQSCSHPSAPTSRRTFSVLS